METQTINFTGPVGSWDQKIRTMITKTGSERAVWPVATLRIRGKVFPLSAYTGKNREGLFHGLKAAAYNLEGNADYVRRQFFSDNLAAPPERRVLPTVKVNGEMCYMVTVDVLDEKGEVKETLRPTVPVAAYRDAGSAAWALANQIVRYFAVGLYREAARLGGIQAEPVDAELIEDEPAFN